MKKKGRKLAKQSVEFAKVSLKVLDDVVLKNKGYLDLILSDTFTQKSYNMGLVDDNNKVNFYDGKVRVVGPDGKELCKYAPREYLEHIAERVEPSQESWLEGFC
jgi:F420-non-reducing hydrogenase large subunit